MADAERGVAGTPTLRISTYRQGGRTVIEAVGDMGLGSLAPLVKELALYAREGRTPLTLDLRRVVSLDGSGLALLAQTSRLLRPSRVPRVLVTPGKQPDRVLQIGSFGLILEIVVCDAGDIIPEVEANGDPGGRAATPS